MKPTATGSKKMIQQIAVLIVILVLIVGLVIYHTAAAHKATTSTTTPTGITTTFDQSALQTIQTRGTDYPDVTPPTSDQGKTNPFGQ